ncbi:MAG: helix-turn-helix domain-containing protein [Kofleriaceae bacterium]
MPDLDQIEELIRKNLILFREQANLSQAQLADLSGVPMANLGRYERGDNAVPASTLGALSHVFGRSVADFYQENPPPPPPEDDLPPVFYRVRPGVVLTPDQQAIIQRAFDEVSRERRALKKRK